MVKLNWNNKEGEIESVSAEDKIAKDSPELRLMESYVCPINENFLKKSEIEFQQLRNKDLDTQIINNWSNILIWGDNISVIASLLKNFSGKINLIYIDPPFATGGNFFYKMHIGDNNAYSSVDCIAYNDIWKEGIDSYINFLYERLKLMKLLLADTGSIYVHLNWHSSHYIKLIMDELFGRENFKNEIIWAFPAASVQTRKFFIRSYDIILFYTKTDNYTFNDDPSIYMEFSDRVKYALKEDEQGIYYYRGGSHDGKKLSRKVYVKEKGIFPRDVWTDIPYIRANTAEYQGFSTQKPERLLKRIILASSKENDIVADFFCGTGTTLIAAEKLNRRWIGSDIAKHAVLMTRRRLLDVYSSNELNDWSKIYNLPPKPFKLLTILKPKDLNDLPKGVFATDFKNIQVTERSNIPSFEVKIVSTGLKVTVELKNYINPLIKVVSEEIRNKIKNWTDWVDFWSIDFNFKSDGFNCVWVAYRTPRIRNLPTFSGSYEYLNQGKFKISIKLIDILGIETIQTYDMEIK